MKKQKQSRGRYRDKAYAVAARRLIKVSYQGSGETSTTGSRFVFYGDAGRGHGSRIQGNMKRSTDKLQEALVNHRQVVSTSEYRSSKICSFCDAPIQPPNKRNGKANLGVITCINPDCISRKVCCPSRDRDANAGINILKIGLYRELTGEHHPSFTRSTTTGTTSAFSSSTIINNFGSAHLEKIMRDLHPV
ncbi:uncharacterized protein BX664DRAFT_326214 [Halteromyces radiatus]|uniref:uncharacterized protein n=1 Tax=Halteromyces radiatus TaxID=101107 RepID=UPI00221F2D58|nr:uncharacterized protein BX664DRAFT_326214 [Halteromyces radiatus]KAI8097368.1 hypothetical protein BX664DRAFT_326214 [Halteromyces radiatus]